MTNEERSIVEYVKGVIFGDGSLSGRMNAAEGAEDRLEWVDKDLLDEFADTIDGLLGDDQILGALKDWVKGWGRPQEEQQAATFAAPKAKGKKGKKGKKNCTKGLSCGASCVKAKKDDGSPTVCKQDNPGSTVKAKAKKTKSGGGGATGGGDAKPVEKAIVDPVPVEPDKDAVKAEKSLEAIAGDFPVDINGKAGDKVDRMKALGLSEGEALAIATWISADMAGDTPKYALMNQVIYAPDTVKPRLRTKVEATNELAKSGYAKLPSITERQMRDRAEEVEDLYDPKAPLSRRVKMPDPEAFLKQYEDSVGKEITEKTHFASTYHNHLSITKGANVTYNIAPKLDGTGQGKLIDQFKNSLNEGEVMFPPGSKFRVASVWRPSQGGPRPKQEPGTYTKSQLSQIDNALTVGGFSGGSWQSHYKQKHGKEAFEALDPSLKEAKSVKKAEAALDKLKPAGKDYDDAVAKWENATYVINLEEV